MDAEQQQRILGYFLEEARDHLMTMEQGLLTFQDTLRDAELLNELFRAAHSVKGGAAMLELAPIQKVAARLEDVFKTLKDNPQAPFAQAGISEVLTSAFLCLQELLIQLHQSRDLPEEMAERVMAAARPLFKTLDSRIGAAIASHPLVPFQVSTPSQNSAPLAPSPKLSPTKATDRSGITEESALHLIFKSDLPLYLRQMLELFKHADEDAVRSELVRLCNTLDRLGEQFELTSWCHVVGLARSAILDPSTSYPEIGAIVLRNLKVAQEQILAGQWEQIQPSPELHALLLPNSQPSSISLNSDLNIPDLDNLMDVVIEPPNPLNPEESSTMANEALSFDEILNELDQSELPLTSNILDFSSENFGEPMGQKSGMSSHPDANDNTLTNLFEEDAQVLANIWEDSSDEQLDNLFGGASTGSDPDSLDFVPTNPQGDQDESDDFLALLDGENTESNILGDLDTSGDLNFTSDESLSLGDDVDDLNIFDQDDSLEDLSGFFGNIDRSPASHDSAYPLDDEISSALEKLPRPPVDSLDMPSFED